MYECRNLLWNSWVTLGIKRKKKQNKSLEYLRNIYHNIEITLKKSQYLKKKYFF